ncbi:MAG: hypothetical protein PUA84_08570 [Oscillospiraceae bacterium]|nr:hypothetical protein [Oscillospiraceae bacterium]
MKVKPLLEAFFSWLEEQNVSGKGKLAKAVHYALNEKKYNSHGPCHELLPCIPFHSVHIALGRTFWDSDAVS